MIYVNYKPVIANPETKLIFADDGSDPVSVVYMRKQDRPSRGDLVWVQIFNRDYIPDHPDNVNRYNEGFSDSESNPFFMFEKWMYVDVVSTNQFIYGEGSTESVEAWEATDGIVEVTLREHRHVFAKRFLTSNINVVDSLNPAVSILNGGLASSLNEMSWEDLAELFFDNNIKIDYALDNAGEYPPYPPLNCPWRGASMLAALQHMVYSYDIRLLEKTLIRANKTYYVSNEEHEYADDDVITFLSFRRRTPLELDDKINYKTLNWPVFDDYIKQAEENAVILFPSFNEGVVFREQSPSGQFVAIGPNVYDLHCHLFPYQSNTSTEMEMMDEYLKENRINVQKPYAFRAPELTPTFYDTKEWSIIELKSADSGLDYFVSHKQRTLRIPFANRIGPPKTYISGFVKEGGNESFIAENVVDTTNQVSYPQDLILPGFLPPTAAGHRFDGVVEGGIFTMIRTESLYPDYDYLEVIPVQHEGDNVTKITHTAQNFTLSCPDSVLNYYPDDGPLNVFNYSYESAEIDDEGNSNATSIGVQEFSTLRGMNNIQIEDAEVAYVTFKMRGTEEEIYDAFKDNFTTGTVGASYAGTVANFRGDYYANAFALWCMENYYRITLRVAMSRDPLRPLFYVNDQPSSPNRYVARSSIHPDLNVRDFIGWGVEVAVETAFPITLSGTPIPDPINISGPQAAPQPLPWKARDLGRRYDLFLNSKAMVVSITKS